MNDQFTPDHGMNGPEGTPTPASAAGQGASMPTHSESTAPPGAPDPTVAAERAVAGAEDAARKVIDAVSGTSAPEVPDLSAAVAATNTEGIGLLEDVQLQVRIELGRTRMLVEDVLRLASGAVVELDKAAGDPVDIYVNGRRIARGEVLVLNENFCVRVSEIVDQQARTA